MPSWHTVIGIAYELVPSGFQFLVEVIEQDIAQHRRHRAALRHALAGRLQAAVDDHPCAQKAAK